MDMDKAVELLRGGRKGVAEWNRLFISGEEAPGLNGVDLSGLDLSEANLLGADLSSSNLSHSNLDGANLHQAICFLTKFDGANIKNVDLSHANLFEASLRHANISDSMLVWAYLDQVKFSGVNLRNTYLRDAFIRPSSVSDADFSGAIFGNTCIAGTLNGALGLDDARHEGPSSIAFDTILGMNPPPERFLRGCGMREEEIEYFRSQVGSPIEFYSCFISYSHADKAFARRLHDQLQGRGIRCWMDEHQVLPGDKIHNVVNHAIRIWDKVILCSSEASLTSWWVDNEIQSAITKEQQLHKQHGCETLALIPLNLDGYMFSSEWTSGWKDQLTCRYAPDFSGWENDNAVFDREFEKVVAALRADERAREEPPASKLWKPGDA